MLSYCLKCGENTKSTSPQVSKTVYDGTIVSSNCAVCNTKKARFIKNKKEKDY